VHRTNLHIYANLISPDARILVSASTLEAEVRAELAGKSGAGYDAASSAAQGASTYTPQNVQSGSFLTGNISGYMNPYVENVESRAIDAANRTLQQEKNAIAASAARAGAFGGSRQGIAEGVAASETARGIGDLSAKLRSDAFNQAAALQAADQNRALQAAQANQAAGLQGAATNIAGATALGNLTGAKLDAAQKEAALVENVGAQKQALAQAALDEAYARFLEKKNYPIEGLNLLLSATSATPYGQSQTQTKTGMPQGNSFLTGLGAVGTAASAAASIASLVAM
jgi:ribosomal protein L18